MISIIRRYKRSIIALGFSLFFLMNIAFLGVLDIWFTSSLCLFAVICIMGYSTFFEFLKNKIDIQSWKRKEFKVMAILIAFLYLIGAIETESDHNALSFFFSLLFLVILLLIFIQYYMAKKKIRAIGIWSISKLGFVVLSMIMMMTLIVLFMYTVEVDTNQKDVIPSGSEEFFELLTPVFFLSLFVFLANWIIRQIKSVIRLKNEKAQTELLHLKSQVNPHFFFNMLNNLYGWVEKDSKKAQELILKLSDMMRYSIYEGEKNLVPLDKEISYLKNYIELHKMRYHKKIEIQFDLDIEEEYKVMPLLFIILLENAFKHGVENLRENAYVHINMIAKKNEIHFIVENNFDNTELNNQPGIGLKNLKRRLELMYPEQHSLSFIIKEDVYKAELTLKKYD
ncbi:sensor histidine kinase [Aquimarina algiphila]|uniref:sensor histidine kinase n=1 Tax=Aquimarina algiphila TaxID=2047982 RepID=UPI0024928BE4|nr:histidine kinase [Aquimarina algiphila]